METSHSYKLSYVLTTYNKLPALKATLTRLLESVQPDEEIIVVDGKSTDGTAEYLRGLHQSGLIHQFMSERDCNQAHGTNKALLAARGELIKILTDDDAYHWPGIQACKQFMLAHPEADALGTDGALVATRKEQPPVFTATRPVFEKYLANRQEYSFGDLGLMLRRSSLALTGLFDPRYVLLDAEFTLRLTSGPARLAWYTGCVWARILNPRSTSLMRFESVRDDYIRLRRYYSVIHRQPSLLVALRDCARTVFRPVKRRWLPADPSEMFPGSSTTDPPPEWPRLLQRGEDLLAERNRAAGGEFLFGPNKAT
ncbi:MAG: glycosyltransferase [Verrucomicrobiota bacterium]